jgi:hypothetical protein
MLGLSLPAFVASHVIVSLIALLSGVILLRHLLGARTPPGIAALFLATTIVTSLGGFLFPFRQLGLGHIVGAASLVVLLAAVTALYGFRLAGAWRWIYAVSAIAALYLNTVIAVTQAFVKVPLLRPFATGLTAPAYLLTQAAVALLFMALGILAARRFHPEPYAPGGLLRPI